MGAETLSLPQAFMVAVLDKDGKRPVGLGLVVGGHQVLTCSHVVVEALGAKTSAAEPPEGDVVLQSVLSGQRVKARVRRESWHPEDPQFKDQCQDLCLLELEAEYRSSGDTLQGLAWDELEHVQLRSGARLSVYGYPNGSMPGIPSDGYLLGGPCDSGWWSMVEPEPLPPGFRRIERGFSGSLAWDMDHQQPVGLVVACRRDEATAYVIPCALLSQVCKSAGAVPLLRKRAAELERPVRTADEQATLTVRLVGALSSERIEVSYFRSPYGDLDVKKSFDDRAALLELHEATTASLDDWKSGDQGARRRSLLFELLFPAETWKELAQGLFAKREAPSRYPVRVRVWAEQPDVASLPWLLTSYGGGRLVNDGWSFEVVAEPAPEDTVAFPSPCRVLVAARIEPSTEGHLTDLRAELGKLSPLRATADYFRLVESKQALLAELATFRPHLLYLYGPAESTAKTGFGLHLKDGLVRLEELTAWLGGISRKPELICINPLLPDTERVVLGSKPLGPQLGAVVVNQGGGAHAEAELSVCRWLRNCFGQGLDPALALCLVGEEAARFSAFTAYRRWSGEPELRQRPKPTGPFELDRESQRAIVDRHVRELVKSRRVDAIIAYAEPGNEIDLFWEQALGYLKETGVVVAQPFALKFPTHQPRSCQDFVDELLVRMEIARKELLRRAMRRKAPEKRGQKLPLLWLNWGKLVGGTFTAKDLSHWLELCSELVDYCEDDLRIVGYLAVEIPTERHGDLKRVIESQGRQLIGINRRFSYKLLDPLGHVPYAELLQFLSDQTKCSCPEPVQATELIFAATEGQYKQTYALIARAERDGWPRVLRELATTRSANVPTEITF